MIFEYVMLIMITYDLTVGSVLNIILMLVMVI
jgi:hypothetical protein